MLTLTKKKMMMITARMSVLAAAVTILFLDIEWKKKSRIGQRYQSAGTRLFLRRHLVGHFDPSTRMTDQHITSLYKINAKSSR